MAWCSVIHKRQDDPKKEQILTPHNSLKMNSKNIRECKTKKSKHLA